MKKFIKNKLKEGLNKNQVEILKNEIRDIDWRKIKISYDGNGGFFTKYFVSLPIDDDKIHKKIDLNAKEGIFTQIHLSLHPMLQGLGLAGKIYKAATQSFGHIFSSKARRSGGGEHIDKVWDKLVSDPEIECYDNEQANICFDKNINPKEKDKLLKHYKKIQG